VGLCAGELRVKDAKDLIPWKVTDLAIRPFSDLWSFNPSICFNGEIWLCVLRCADYCMKNGVTTRSPKSGPGHQTKNAMVILDPATWQPIKIFKMRELDEHPRTPCANVGYEDMRIFRTDRGDLQGIAASLHLKRDGRPAAGGAQHQPPEQVLLSFDDEYNIVKAQPIRGDRWSGPQKNWSPFDNCAEPRFLYSIDRGTLFGDRGALRGDDAVVRPSSTATPLSIATPHAVELPPPVEPVQERERLREHSHPKHTDHRTHNQGRGGVQLVRGGGRRVTADTLSSRPSSIPRVASSSAPSPARIPSRAVTNESARVLGTGRALLPKYHGLRGGTQLVRVGDDAWLGIGHEMKFVNSRKYYWHTFYLVDSRGKMKAASEPFKMAPEGIEFAAGLAIDGDRAVVSFGVDDMECRLGETKLSAVMEILRPVEE